MDAHHQVLLGQEHRVTPSRTSTASKASKKKSTSLPSETVEYLKAWMMSPEHIAHPYPTELEKAQIMKDTGIEMKQLTNWFVNNRKRFWKPRVEARLRESKQQESEVVPTSPPIIKRNGSVLSLKEFLAVKASEEQNNNTSVPKQTTTTRRRSTRASGGGNVSDDSDASSPARLISEHNSVVSASDSAASSDDEDASVTGDFTEEEEEEVEQEPMTQSVNVHIMRPANGGTPELHDVSIEDDCSASEVLRTFKDCAVTYRVNEPDMASCERQNEIERIKKHYLRLYLAETKPASPAPSPVPRKRAATQDETPSSPRTKYRRVSVETWKRACQSASHIYDHNLPSLEEASQLFGFAS